MPYRFNFDLTSISRAFFTELVKVAHEKKLHSRFGKRARNLAERFRLSEITGLDVSNVLQLVEDLADIYIQNFAEREHFEKTRSRVLFVPHCARKYMDNRCQAIFDPSAPSYVCSQCSPECLVNRATKLGKERGYDVYILPGGSCIPEVLKKKRYEAISRGRMQSRTQVKWSILKQRWIDRPRCSTHKKRLR